MNHYINKCLLVCSFLFFTISCGTYQVATKSCEGRNCAKNWSNEYLTVKHCARDANHAKTTITGSEVHDALVQKTSDACDLGCTNRTGCASHDTCTEQSNSISPGMLLAPGWSCSRVGPDDSCIRGQEMYSCRGKYATLRGNVFCKCTLGTVTAFMDTSAACNKRDDKI